MRERILTFLFIFLVGCSTVDRTQRLPSSALSSNPCTQGIQAFFDDASKKEIGLISESRLISEGLIRKGEIKGMLEDPVYKGIINAEDEALREDSAKILVLIRKHRPELEPKRVMDFYHELFHSCKL